MMLITYHHRFLAQVCWLASTHRQRETRWASLTLHLAYFHESSLRLRRLIQLERFNSKWFKSNNSFQWSFSLRHCESQFGHIRGPPTSTNPYRTVHACQWAQNVSQQCLAVNCVKLALKTSSSSAYFHKLYNPENYNNWYTCKKLTLFTVLFFDHGAFKQLWLTTSPLQMEREMHSVPHFADSY